MYGLNTAFDFVTKAVFYDNINFFGCNLYTGVCHLFDGAFSDALSGNIHKWRQMRKRETLPTILVRCHLGDYLRCNIASGMESVRFLYHGACDYCTILEHVLQIHQVAVVHFLDEIIRIMEVDYSVFMSLPHFFRKEHSLCDVLGDFPCHIVSLCGIYNRILVGILLLCLFVI